MKSYKELPFALYWPEEGQGRRIVGRFATDFDLIVARMWMVDRGEGGEEGGEDGGRGRGRGRGRRGRAFFDQLAGARGPGVSGLGLRGGRLRYVVRTRSRWDNGPRVRGMAAASIVARSAELGIAVAVVAARGGNRDGVGCSIHDGGFLVWLEGEERHETAIDVAGVLEECRRRVIARKTHWRHVIRCGACELVFRDASGKPHEAYVDFYASELECPRCWRCSKCGFRLPRKGGGAVDVELWDIWGGRCPGCVRSVGAERA